MLIKGKKQKILFLYDFHKKPVNTTIKGFVNNTSLIQKEIMRKIIDNEITILITLGDYYDRGFANHTAAAVSQILLDTEMRSLVTHWFGLRGNHIYLGLNTNPEMSLAQPSTQFPQDTQNIKSVINIDENKLIVNDKVQINMFHYTPTDTISDYIGCREEGVECNIGLYHTELAFPEFSNYLKLNKLYDGIDYSLPGHIHKKYGILEQGRTKILAFGASNNVSNTVTDLKPSAILPMLTVEEDGSFEWNYLKQDLHMDNVKFKKSKPVDKEDKEAKLELKRTKSTTVVINQDNSIEGAPVFKGARAYLESMNYTQAELRHLYSIIEKPSDLQYHIQAYSTREE